MCPFVSGISKSTMSNWESVTAWSSICGHLYAFLTQHIHEIHNGPVLFHNVLDFFQCRGLPCSQQLVACQDNGFVRLEESGRLEDLGDLQRLLRLRCFLQSWLHHGCILVILTAKKLCQAGHKQWQLLRYLQQGQFDSQNQLMVV